MDFVELRQAAIELVANQSATSGEGSEEPVQDLIYELRVHRAELEMQNDELRRNQFELEVARDRFANLFDFAPVGYLTVDHTSRIVEANLTAARMLCVNRGSLVGQQLPGFVSVADAGLLKRHLRDVAISEQKVSCIVSLKTADSELIRVRLDTICADDDCRHIAITDLSETDELIRAKKESDERLRIICQALPIPVAFVDRNQTYQFNNTAHELWFADTRQAIKGQTVRQVFGQTYQSVEKSIEAALDGITNSCPVEFQTSDSGSRPAEMHYAPCRDESDNVVGFYEFLIDTRLQRHVEEETARQRKLEAKLTRLSPRQRAVFDLLMLGSSNSTIAMQLNQSKRTVERERHNILQLTEVGSINELLVTFARLPPAQKPDEQSGNSQFGKAH